MATGPHSRLDAEVETCSRLLAPCTSTCTSSRSPDCWGASWPQVPIPGWMPKSKRAREQHQDRDGRMQLTTHQCRRQFLISSPLQTREDVLQRTQQHIFLDEVRLESKACTVQTNIEITVPVENVRLISDLESSSISRRCAATQQPIFLDDVCMESKACTVQTNIEITVPVENVRLISDLESSSNPRRCAVTHSTDNCQRQGGETTITSVEETKRSFSDTAVSMTATWSHPCKPAGRNFPPKTVI